MIYREVNTSVEGSICVIKNNKIIIWYDNDNAGKIASEKIKNKILKLFNAEITLFFCTVHKDPSDTLKENKELFKKELTKLKKLL